MHDSSFTATTVFVEGESGDVIAYIEELPGAHAQGQTIDEARELLHEATEIILAGNRRLNHETFASARVLLREVYRSRRRRAR